MIIMQKNILNRDRAEDGFNNQSLFKNFNESKKRKFQNDSNLDFKSFREDDDVITRVFNNDIKWNVYTHNNRNNDVCVHYEKKNHWKSDYFNLDKFQIYVVMITSQSKND